MLQEAEEAGNEKKEAEALEAESAPAKRKAKTKFGQKKKKKKKTKTTSKFPAGEEEGYEVSESSLQSFLKFISYINFTLWFDLKIGLPTDGSSRVL
mgnify:CR=1 FL=1